MTSIVALKKNEFFRLSHFIHDQFGIKMPEAKKTLLESRLQKRLRLLNLSSFSEYCDFLFSEIGLKTELPLFIDNITTNKTDFFREPDHFEYLAKQVLPEFLDSGNIPQKPLRVWSAGCSTGEEPYTIAMVVDDYFERKLKSRPNYSILATDLSIEVLKSAKNAIYHESKVLPIPLAFKKKYLLKSKNRMEKRVKVVPELRSKVKIGQLNFMDKAFKLSSPMDIVFCRNVIIYFDKSTQERILKNICKNLVRGGFFFQGHSESIQGMELPLKQVSPTIYKKTVI